MRKIITAIAAASCLVLASAAASASPVQIGKSGWGDHDKKGGEFGEHHHHSWHHEDHKHHHHHKPVVI